MWSVLINLFILVGVAISMPLSPGHFSMKIYDSSIPECIQTCDKSYSLHTSDQTEKHNACARGCRLGSIGNLLSSSKPKSNNDECKKSCKDAYKDEVAMKSACELGCQNFKSAHASCHHMFHDQFENMENFMNKHMENMGFAHMPHLGQFEDLENDFFGHLDSIPRIRKVSLGRKPIWSFLNRDASSLKKPDDKKTPVEVPHPDPTIWSSRSRGFNSISLDNLVSHTMGRMHNLMNFMMGRQSQLPTPFMDRHGGQEDESLSNETDANSRPVKHWVVRLYRNDPVNHRFIIHTNDNGRQTRREFHVMPKRLFDETSSKHATSAVAAAEMKSTDQVNSTAESLNWITCIKKRLNLPRILVACTLVLSTVLMLWLCLSAISTAPFKRKQKSCSGHEGKLIDDEDMLVMPDEPPKVNPNELKVVLPEGEILIEAAGPLPTKHSLI